MVSKGRFHFVTEVKNELTRISPLYTDEGESCCRRAELAALFRMGAVLKFGSETSADTFAKISVSFANNNAAVTRRVFALLRAEDSSLPLNTAVARANRLRKRNSYIVTAKKSAATTRLLEHLEFIRDGHLNIGNDNGLLRRECCRRAYLLGAFLGGGSINRPEAQNHLEMATSNLAMAELICELLHRLDFPAGLYERRDDFVVYVKEGDSIIEFLAMLNADESVERFEVATNLKAVRVQVNRLVNLETANLQRAVDNAAKQIVALEKLRVSAAWNELSSELKRTVQLRLENPEASLSELAQLLYLTKSGLNHRLQKLTALSEKIGGGTP